MEEKHENKERNMNRKWLEEKKKKCVGEVPRRERETSDADFSGLKVFTYNCRCLRRAQYPPSRGFPAHSSASQPIGLRNSDSWRHHRCMWVMISTGCWRRFRFGIPGKVLSHLTVLTSDRDFRPANYSTFFCCRLSLEFLFLWNRRTFHFDTKTKTKTY